jgi:glutathione S-transferase
MAHREARLYGIPMSHPVIAVQGMLDRKGMPYRYVELLAGAHPPSLWALGFRRSTVPALRLPDGRRVQGSLAIAQALERAAPEPSLYPLDPEARGDAQRSESAPMVRRRGQPAAGTSGDGHAADAARCGVRAAGGGR